MATAPPRKAPPGGLWWADTRTPQTPGWRQTAAWIRGPGFRSRPDSCESHDCGRSGWGLVDSGTCEPRQEALGPQSLITACQQRARLGSAGGAGPALLSRDGSPALFPPLLAVCDPGQDPVRPREERPVRDRPAVGGGCLQRGLPPARCETRGLMAGVGGGPGVGRRGGFLVEEDPQVPLSTSGHGGCGQMGGPAEHQQHTCGVTGHVGARCHPPCHATGPAALCPWAAFVSGKTGRSLVPPTKSVN